MSEIWRTASMEGKWKNGKGQVVLSTVDYYQRIWIDARLHNMHREGTTHTKHGFRLSIEQAEDFVNALNVAIERAKEEMEQKQRSEGNEQDNN